MASIIRMILEALFLMNVKARMAGTAMKRPTAVVYRAEEIDCASAAV